MIYERGNLNTKMKNSTNKGQQALISKLAWLITNERFAVISASRNAGVDISKSASPEQVKNIIISTINDQETKSSRLRAKKLVLNLAVLAESNKSKRDKFVGFLNADGDDNPYGGMQGEGSSAVPEPDKKTSFDKGAAANAAIQLFNVLFSSKGQNQLDEQVGGYSNIPKNSESSGMSTGAIIGVGLVSLALISGAVWFFGFRKGK